MKFKPNYIFLLQLTALLFLAVSCGSDDESLQRIDQIMNFSLKNSAGQDLLNGKKAGSYTAYSVNDFNGLTDVAPVSIPLKMTTDSLYYFEYLSGARRIIKDSISPENKTYRSDLRFSFSRTVNNQVVTVTDAMEIHYRWTPSLFQVSEVLYNGQVVFSKAADAPNAINTFTIIK
ncbi:hypothetical protein B0A69_11360 [Chryseobacterium shigense]|uniref:Uncharacterized protein n=1 Tax=Chryseobacterium shigense TaxID=297244 RepID=A0A1N7J6S2_9FLAO|nr:hypothetical protein [Chryseobacterium shigense]PQA93592.1 hypothetical protein B0A69_11360 [Chryseobacterium shigense]SIS44936.1 hypothetical protein SAMN05421639_105178 [Chryseobacterium shigense]